MFCPAMDVGSLGCGHRHQYQGAIMDPLARSLVWGIGLMVLVALAVLIVFQLRRRFTISDDADTAPSDRQQTDWVALLTNLQLGRLAPTTWMALAPTLVQQASTCPPALRAALITAFDRAIAQSSDPLVVASMTQVRRALAALPSA